MCLLDKIKQKAEWKREDDYPSCEEWKKEDNQLLEFARKESVLANYQNRLQSDNKTRRDETMNELRAAYFLNKGCNASFQEWHPNDGQGEFVAAINEKKIFCEVKSPGWEGEIATIAGRNSPRIQQPKYIHAETRGVDNSPHVRDTVKKSYRKFPNNMPTLLIIVDDFWMDCFTEGLCIDRALYRSKLPPPYVDAKPEGLFVGKNYEKLGGVLFIKFELVVNQGFVWKIHLAINSNSLSIVRLPEQFLDAFESAKKIDGNLVKHYMIKNGWLEEL